MIEDSPEAFVQRWRRHAAEVQLFPRTEGSPLLECMAAGTIVQLLDRSGPYTSGPGPRRVILNAMVDRLEPAVDEHASLEVAGLGKLRGTGRVVDHEGGITVIDCGVPVVVAVMDAAAEPFDEGRHVTFDVLPPVHGFVLPDASGSRSGASFEDTDDAM